MEKDGFIAFLGEPVDSGVESLSVVWDVVRIERPEILFVREAIHNFRLSWFFSQQFEQCRYVFDGNFVTDNIRL